MSPRFGRGPAAGSSGGGDPAIEDYVEGIAGLLPSIGPSASVLDELRGHLYEAASVRVENGEDRRAAALACIVEFGAAEEIGIELGSVVSRSALTVTSNVLLATSLALWAVFFTAFHLALHRLVHAQREVLAVVDHRVCWLALYCAAGLGVALRAAALNRIPGPQSFRGWAAACLASATALLVAAGAAGSIIGDIALDSPNRYAWPLEGVLALVSLVGALALRTRIFWLLRSWRLDPFRSQLDSHGPT